MNRTTRIVTPPASSALTTLATLKDNIQVTDTASDAFLNRRIAAASSWAANYCGRAFGVQTVEDSFRLTSVPWGQSDPVCGQDRVRQIRPLTLSLDHLDPAAAALSIVSDGVTVDPSTYVLDGPAGLVWRIAASGVQVQWTGSLTVATYVAGWVLPPDSSSYTLPETIQDAVIDRAALGWFARGRDPNVSREKVEGVGETFYLSLPDETATDGRLDPFRIRTF